MDIKLATLIIMITLCSGCNRNNGYYTFYLENYKAALISNCYEKLTPKEPHYNSVQCELPNHFDKQSAKELDSMTIHVIDKIKAHSDTATDFSYARENHYQLNYYCISQELVAISESKAFDRLAHSFAKRMTRKKREN